MAPWHLDLVDVLLAVDLILCLFQKLQHLLDDGLQCTAQVFSAVRLSERRHMNKGRATVAKVQGRVVGEITEIPVRKSSTAKINKGLATLMEEFTKK